MKLKEIHIKNFRGIKNQKIESIEDALILIGKNNAGKSAFLAAIRTLFGDYIPQDKDIYYGCDEFKIDAILVCDEAYISDYFWIIKLVFSRFLQRQIIIKKCKMVLYSKIYPLMILKIREVVFLRICWMM